MKDEELKPLVYPEWAMQLGQFTGTEGYHRLLVNAVLTDGMKFLCEKAGCFWLATDVTLLGLDRTGELNDGFCVVRVQASPEARGQHCVDISIGDGNGEFKPVNTLVMTDFPPGLLPFEFFVQWAPDVHAWVFMLKSEY